MGGGGAERVMLNLAIAFARNNVKVDLVLAKRKGPLLSDVPSTVNIVELEKSSWLSVLLVMIRLPISNIFSIFSILILGKPKVFKRLPSLIGYLEERNPDSILSTLDSVNLTTLWARHLTSVDTKFFIRQATFHSKHVHHAKAFFDRKVLPSLVRRWYPTADKIIALSDLMKIDLINFSGIDKNRIKIIYNPVDLERIEKRLCERIDEIWFIDKNAPIVMAAGRLDKNKDYPTLFNAINIIKSKRDIKLVVLGDGDDRSLLQERLDDLELNDCVKLLGYVNNPYKYMAKSDVFVLCSKLEGFPNVLIEALACGSKIVSTDCPSGPREILDQGRFGRLVAPRSPEELADAILHTIDSRVDISVLKKRAAFYSVDNIVEEYMDCLLNKKIA